MASPSPPVSTITTPSVMVNNPIYILIDFRIEDNNIDVSINSEFKQISWRLVDSVNFSTVCEETFENSYSIKDIIEKLNETIQTNIILKEKPFSFITLNSWYLKMKLANTSRELNLKVSNYIEYPRYFDLIREFIKFQDFNQIDNVNVNNDNNGSLSLNSMMSILNIKVDSNESNIDSILKIVKKLVELDNSSNIFKKPHDMNLDLNQFFIEKSRILYLTNLPADTTQSELESWFTQFGGRPIAFWTIMTTVSENNNNSNNSTISTNNANSNGKATQGFAIFSNHEDAIESLKMNGKILNEKIIEVQPSSVRVLDKAQEILTPFPSSKNKPRPGDWTCPSCGFSNFQRRTACFRCSFPAASAAAIQESIYGVNTNTNSNSNSNINTTINSSSSINNNTNNSNNNVNMNLNGNSSVNLNNHFINHNNNNGIINNSSNNSGNHHYHNNTNGNGLPSSYQSNNNNNNNNSRSSSSNVPFRAGDWKCIVETCSYHNFAKNVCCLKCGAPRVQSAIINGHAHNQHHNHHNNHNHHNHHQLNNNSNNNDFNYQSRSNSLPNHIQQQQQQQQHANNNNNNTNNNNSVKYNKQLSDLYGFTVKSRSQLSSVPSTPTFTGYTSNNDPSLELASRISGLNLTQQQNQQNQQQFQPQPINMMNFNATNLKLNVSNLNKTLNSPSGSAVNTPTSGNLPNVNLLDLNRSSPTPTGNVNVHVNNNNNNNSSNNGIN